MNIIKKLIFSLKNRNKIKEPISIFKEVDGHSIYCNKYNSWILNNKEPCSRCEDGEDVIFIEGFYKERETYEVITTIDCKIIEKPKKHLEKECPKLKNGILLYEEFKRKYV